MPDSYRMCSVDGCEGKHFGRGYCKKHYNRLWEKGSLPGLTQSLCSVEGCTGFRHGRGYCKKHFTRIERHGDPLHCELGKPLEFIQAIVKNPPKDCVIWPFAKKESGHGRLAYQKQQVPAHRLALILYSGLEPDGLQALHGRCHDPACINPLHLRWGTQSENMLDRILDGTDNRGDRHPLAKLTESQVLEIKSLLGKESGRAIAQRFNVSPGTICNIKKGRSWAWLKPLASDSSELVPDPPLR